MKKKAHSFPLELTLIIVTLMLAAIGLFFVLESSMIESINKYAEPYFFVRQQTIRLGIGLIMMLVAYLIPIKFWQKTAWVWYVLSVVLLFMVLIPGLGLKLNGARRWLSIANLSFQPIEFVKFALTLFFASWMNKHQRLGPFLFLTAIPSILVLLQPDLGSLLTVLAITFGLYFLAGGSWKNLLLILTVGVMFVILSVIFSPYRLQRLQTYLNPDTDPLGAGFHIRQITIALGNGGWFGQGLGNSQQKYLYIPEASSDSIFAIVAEEIGFIGSIFIFTLYLSYFYLAYKIIQKVKVGSFAYLVGFGIALWISCQSILNLAAIVALIPLTGLPLPFFSYGGTSLIMTLLATGVLVRIGKEADKVI